tara:strand:+ start:10917 stop:12692 length:1776 start_codon:yes stop_codon:yes gene_type:complete
MVSSTKTGTAHLPHIEHKLSIQCNNFADDSTAIRSLDWDRSRFDIEFGLRNGTTYNSFIIKGEEVAIIDTSHSKFEKLWIESLIEKVDPKQIKYLITSHTEPDHSGLIKDLLSLNSDITIVGSKIALKFIEDQIHQSFNRLEVKSGEFLNLGKNKNSGIEHKIEFISAPNLHWPDTIFSYDHGTQVLYTCDAFGLHYCSNEFFDSNQKEIFKDFRFYYDCLMGPNARSVIQALKKIDKLPEVNAIAVGHGPILRNHVDFWKDKYSEWSNNKSKGNEFVAVCYISDYGFCDRLSQAISHGINKADAQVQLIDLRSSDSQELTALINEAKAIVIPTWPLNYDSDLQESIGTLFAALKPKQLTAIYDSFGGNDEPIDSLANKLRGLQQKEALSPLRVKEIPNPIIYQKFEEAGTDLGQLINKKKNIASIKNLDSNLDKALGRLSGGLYVVTASEGAGADFRQSAMVASWVSQASFSPPGITVAVAKDRAIESFMQVNKTFVINILREDNYQKMFRHFLKRFAPGANRFADVEIIKNLAKGGPVLAESLAYLDCKVISRLETPDHWIIYGTVKNGRVSDLSCKTAVHHRKVANHY